MKNLMFLFLFISQALFAQNQMKTTNELIGSWEGAFIKSNSYQKIEVDFYERDGQLYGLQMMDEWNPTYWGFEVPVKVDSVGKITFGTGYGRTELVLDIENLEMVGQLIGLTPTIYMHLKKVAERPAPNYSIEEVSINSDGSRLYGHLHLPHSNPTNTVIIFVGGRGCGADETEYNLYAKFLRKYGIAVMTYQKRGTGKSTGDCGSATIKDLATDLIAVKKYLDNRDKPFSKVGTLGVSAGGWTMVKAEENIDFDFMISIVGPSTSVKDQQLQSAMYGADFYGLSEPIRKELMTYTDLMLNAKPSAETFTKMENLLLLAEKNRWRALLEDTDIPSSASAISDLWVRRHDYDPKDILSNYNKPFLALYGEDDFIVPYKENIETLNTYFEGREDQMTAIMVHNAEHGMEMARKWIILGQDRSYWHFYRISPKVRIAIVDFLNKHGLKR
ncbi:MAG: alpha/beta hydrolase [Bacteroidota bacterium]